MFITAEVIIVQSLLASWDGTNTAVWAEAVIVCCILLDTSSGWHQNVQLTAQ